MLHDGWLPGVSGMCRIMGHNTCRSDGTGTIAWPAPGGHLYAALLGGHNRKRDRELPTVVEPLTAGTAGRWIESRHRAVAEQSAGWGSRPSWAGCRCRSPPRHPLFPIPTPPRWIRCRGPISSTPRYYERNLERARKKATLNSYAREGPCPARRPCRRQRFRMELLPHGVLVVDAHGSDAHSGGALY